MNFRPTALQSRIKTGKRWHVVEKQPLHSGNKPLEPSPGGNMANMRALSDTTSEWEGCGQETYDFATIEPFLKNIERAPIDKRAKLLLETVERQVIPILSRSHTNKNVQETDVDQVKEDQVREFVDLLIGQNQYAEINFVEKLNRQGLDFDGLLLGLFTPAARVLGEMWEEDTCDFSDVTVALSQLHQLLHHFGAAFEPPLTAEWNGRSALLVTAPGDQHTFGVMVLQEFFRRAGWHVHGGAVASEEELLSMAKTDRYDVVGISVSHDVSVDQLASVIRAVREVSSSPDMVVMVGGRFFLAKPECVAKVGADASAQDGRRAVLKVSSLLDTKALS